MKLDPDPAGLTRADVGQAMSYTFRHPGDVSRFKLDVFGALACRRIAQVKIGDSDNEVWAAVSMFWKDAGRLEFDV